MIKFTDNCGFNEAEVDISWGYMLGNMGVES